VSIIIPKKESEVVGPSIFLEARGCQDQNINEGMSPGFAGRWVIVVGLQIIKVMKDA